MLPRAAGRLTPLPRQRPRRSLRRGYRLSIPPQVLPPHCSAPLLLSPPYNPQHGPDIHQEEDDTHETGQR